MKRGVSKRERRNSETAPATVASGARYGRATSDALSIDVQPAPRSTRSASISPGMLASAPPHSAFLAVGKIWRSLGIVRVARRSSLPSSSPLRDCPLRGAVADDLDVFHDLIDGNTDAVYSLFMKYHQCYNLIPTSSKLVVFDTQLPVRKAFFALVYNGVRAAPLWDSVQQKFVGMLTITDFIHILHRYYKSGQTGGIKELEEHRIATWREVLDKASPSRPMITIDANESLYKAVQTLCDHRVHRLPVMDPVTRNVSYILTHKRLIKFLYLYLNDLPRPAFMERPPRELGIGTWHGVETVSADTPLIVALSRFLERRVSALPLVDTNGRVVDIYAKFDVINLAAEKAYNDLDISVEAALRHRNEWFEGVRSCGETDSLATVIDTLVKAEVHRLVITDAERRVSGIVSLSDILEHLVLSPPSDADAMDTSGS